jgi:hypothetical protein
VSGPELPGRTARRNGPGQPNSTAVGKTAVSSSIIDRVVASLGREQVEVPVGSAWSVVAESFKCPEHQAMVQEAAKGPGE